MLTTSPHLKASIYTLLFSKQTYLSNTPLPCFILGILHLLNMNKTTANVYRLKFYFVRIITEKSHGVGKLLNIWMHSTFSLETGT